VADLGDAVRRLVAFSRGSGNGEAVVMRSDLHLASREIHHWLVDAAVPVSQLERAKAERSAEELIAEADAEVGDAGRQHRPEKRNLLIGRLRVARAVGKEHTVGVQRNDLVKCDRRRHNLNLKPPLSHSLRRHGLDAEVDRDYTEPRYGYRPHDVGASGTHFISKMRPHHRRLRLDALQQRGCAGFDAGDTNPHCPLVPDVPSQGSSIDIAHSDDALGPKLGIEAAAGTPAGGDSRRIAHDVSGNPDSA
jgi:hypothetical protein